MAEILQNEGYQGVNQRTVRFYIQSDMLPPRELIDGKLVYTDKHLDCLRAIRTMQRTGEKLSDIKASLQNVSSDSLRSINQQQYQYVKELSYNLFETSIEKVNNDISITFSSRVPNELKEQIVQNVSEFYDKHKGEIK